MLCYIPSLHIFDFSGIFLLTIHDKDLTTFFPSFSLSIGAKGVALLLQPTSPSRLVSWLPVQIHNLKLRKLLTHPLPISSSQRHYKCILHSMCLCLSLYLPVTFNLQIFSVLHLCHGEKKKKALFSFFSHVTVNSIM